MHSPATRAVLTCSLAVLLQACLSHEGKRCRELMVGAQNEVSAIQPSSLESVEASLAKVDEALAACRQAGLSSETKQLERARQEIGEHHDKLKNRKPKEKKQLTPEELARLAKEGDDTCPKGMAYRPAGTDKEVRCTGPVPTHMPWESAERYFSKRGYKLSPGDAPNLLKAEYGAELLVFQYAEPKSTRPPLCLTLYPAPGIPWEEAVARVTGAPLNRITKNGSVRGPNGELKLSVEEDANKLVIRIGAC